MRILSERINFPWDTFSALAVFKEITYHLLDSTLFPIALPLLKKSAVAVESKYLQCSYQFFEFGG